MRILAAAGQDFQLNPISADSFGNRTCIRRRGDNIQSRRDRMCQTKNPKNKNNRKKSLIIFHENLLKLMSSMRTDREFELKPDRMIIRMMIPVVVIVLQTDFRKLRWEPGQIRREPPTVRKRERFTGSIDSLLHIA